jgi:DNA-binding transcriptional regulator YhcF (GntR family)
VPRPRSQSVSAVKEQLISRLRDGFHQPGIRFLSNRAVARRFGISYQTAHRLIGELVVEGWLERQAGSGTYVAGRRQEWRGVDLVFNLRAQRTESFGAHLLGCLVQALERLDLRHRVNWDAGPAARAEDGWYPIVWERSEFVRAVAAQGRYALVLEDGPLHGVAASFVDTVSVDDFSGGVAAAEWMTARLGSGRGLRLAVLAGPRGDIRNRLRVEGFLSVCKRARVVQAGGWFWEDGVRAAPKVLDYDGVFAANDRLASAVLATAEARGTAVPCLIGFDDAPVAERMNLSTIAIPWEEIASTAAEVAQRRLQGDMRTAAGIIFSPRPVSRR